MDLSGQYQINVKRFPPTEERWVISSGYGEEPFWSKDGSVDFTEEGISGYQLQLRRPQNLKLECLKYYLKGLTGMCKLMGDANGEKFFLLKQPDQAPPKRN